jgi:hypothetical protein
MRALADVEAADESFFAVVKGGEREALVGALAALASVKRVRRGLPRA